MSIDQQSFKYALARFASGVTVVSTRRRDGAPIGVTVSAFCSVSLVPPLILVCLDKSNADLDAYIDGERFCVNVLSVDQATVSNAFAFAGPVPPFEKTAYTEGLGGIPLIDDTAAALQCARHAVHEAGDHYILIGLVEEATWRDAEPLLYACGDYRQLAPVSEAAE